MLGVTWWQTCNKDTKAPGSKFCSNLFFFQRAVIPLHADINFILVWFFKKFYKEEVPKSSFLSITQYDRIDQSKN